MDQNLENSTANQEKPEPHTEETKPQNQSKKWLYVVVVLAFLLLAGLVIFVLGNRKGSAPAPATQSQTKTTPEKKPSPVKSADGDTLAACGTGLSRYADKAFGATFCYPSAWGSTALEDAKVAASDTGQRELIRFSEQPFLIVGGMSQDWSTTVGRGVGCLEPDNVVPALSSYNTAWHDMEGSGAEVSFAIRSLPSGAGGYSIEESVSNMVTSGVCVHGHKVINGSRYKVVAVNFGRDFAPASGITTPAQHIAEPNVLFPSALRAQYDAVLASLEAY